MGGKTVRGGGRSSGAEPGHLRTLVRQAVSGTRLVRTCGVDETLLATQHAHGSSRRFGVDAGHLAELNLSCGLYAAVSPCSTAIVAVTRFIEELSSPELCELATSEADRRQLARAQCNVALPRQLRSPDPIPN